MKLIHFYRFYRYLYVKKLYLFSKVVYSLSYYLFNSSVPPKVQIGRNTVFSYGGIGLVIHSDTVIGDNCVIGQGITIGGRSKHTTAPKIGNNVYLGAGCRILGPIEIGDNVIVGPNAVVIKSIPSNCIAVGVPAVIKKKDINPTDFI
jgi:serine O-acetyltransferase